VVADFGDKVNAGQVMLKINQSEYELRVQTAQAALDQARAKARTNRRPVTIAPNQNAEGKAAAI